MIVYLIETNEAMRVVKITRNTREERNLKGGTFKPHSNDVYASFHCINFFVGAPLKSGNLLAKLIVT